MTPENKQISINGKFISGYKHFSLSQKINDHHTFEIGIDLEAGETTAAHTLDRSKDWLGKTIVIKTTEKDFTGIVTKISLNQNKGNNGQIIVAGQSSTIVLDDSAVMQSWSERPLADIVRDVTDNPNITAAIAPENTATIAYESQYLETNFKFLQRIAKQHHEWLYYDGDTLFFGKPKLSSPIKIEYGKDLYEMNIGIRAQARKSRAFSFKSSEVRQLNGQSPDSPAGLNELGQHAFNASLKTFSTGGNAYTSARVQNKSDIDDYVRKKQQSAAATSNVITGKSTKKGLTVGSVIDIETAVHDGMASYTTKKHGKYIITEITHNVKEADYYTNSFVALSADIPTLPEPDVALPVARTQMATVLSNEDPKKKGRVQVRMNWQSGEMKSDWIRVMTPDAGKSDEHGEIRGNLVIPELGDQVLLGFRYGDPNRPFVMGSIYNGGNISKGKANRNSLVSRMGSKMVMDDNDGSLQLTDKGGVDMKFDGAGNASTNINSNNTVNAGSTNTFNVGSTQTINVGAKKNSPPNSTLTMDAEGNIMLEGKTKITLKVGESSITITEDEIKTLIAQGNITTEATNGENKMISNTLDITSKTTCSVKSKSTMEIMGSEVEINKG